MKKKERINYYEDVEQATFLRGLPYHTMSDFIREAVASKRKKVEKKGLK